MKKKNLVLLIFLMVSISLHLVASSRLFNYTLLEGVQRYNTLLYIFEISILIYFVTTFVKNKPVMYTLNTILFIFLFLFASLSSFILSCSVENVKEVNSPDGKYIAISWERNCGALSQPGYFVKIKENKFLSRESRLFVSNTSPIPEDIRFLDGKNDTVEIVAGSGKIFNVSFDMLTMQPINQLRFLRGKLVQ